MGEIFLLIIALISLYYFIQLLRGKLNLKSKSDGSELGGGTGGEAQFDYSWDGSGGGDGGGS